jgi:hypothetical protein
MATREGQGKSYRFRVSDVVDVPLRGYLLRLRLLDGTPSLDDLSPGKTVRLVGPDGGARPATVKAISVTGGRATQKRMEEKRELDIVISPQEAVGDGGAVEIGWLVAGA